MAKNAVLITIPCHDVVTGWQQLHFTQPSKSQHVGSDTSMPGIVIPLNGLLSLVSVCLTNAGLAGAHESVLRWSQQIHFVFEPVFR